MPRNTVAGPIISLFALVLGFALVWHIWWLAAVGALGVVISFLARVFNDDIDYYVPAAEVARIEREHQQRKTTPTASDSTDSKQTNYAEARA